MVTCFDFISAARFMKSEEKWIFAFIETDVGVFLHIFVTIGAKRALSAIFFSRGEKEIRW